MPADSSSSDALVLAALTDEVVDILSDRLSLPRTDDSVRATADEVVRSIVLPLLQDLSDLRSR